MAVISALLAATLGSLLAALLLAVALRVGAAIFRIRGACPLGEAARAIFYPLVLATMAAVLLRQFAPVAWTREPWFLWAALALQWALFVPGLWWSIDADLTANLTPRRGCTLKLTFAVLVVYAVLQGVFLAVYLRR